MSLDPGTKAMVGLAVIGALVAEWVLSRRHRVHYDVRDALCNVSIFLVNAALRTATMAWALALLYAMHRFAVFQIPTTPLVLLGALLATDFIYYWYHRWNHEIPFLWALHHTHHSSSRLNLTTAVRLNWFGKFLSPLFYTPLALAGVSPPVIVVCFTVVLGYQFLLHTEAVPKLGGFEGTLLNTPSAHRVHHGSNEQYIDKNYGGILVIWDQLFGSYEPEVDRVRYGVLSGPAGNNPLVVQWRPLWQYFNGKFDREKNRLHEATSTSDHA